MYDLTFILPLYGENFFTTSLMMFSSLLRIRTSKSINVLVFYDETTPIESIDYIEQLIEQCKSKNISFEFIFSENTHSGYKRNKGIEKASENSKYIWLIDQDDWLLIEEIDKLILLADELIEKEKRPLVRIDFQRQTLVGAKTNIDEVLSMPWQYIIDAKIAAKYKFDETVEMNSDVPFIFGIIEGENITELMKTNDAMYYYNYLSPDSESYKWFVTDKKTSALQS